MMNKVIQIIFKTFLLSVLVAGQVNFSYAQTASILPPAKTTFLDNNGKPLVSGKVKFYIPGTTTNKTTWQDSGETIPNTNPVVLDGSGRAIILGDGSYRQQVFDRLGNLIWDQQTSSQGSGGGGTTPTVGDGDAVGTVKPWSGLIAPNAYVFSYGQELARASFPLLFSTLTSQQNVACTSGSPTLTGLSDTTQLPVGAAIESVCLNAGATVASTTISTVTASSNAIISTTSSARFFPFGNGDGSLTFNVPDLRGRVLAGRDNMGSISANRLTSAATGFGSIATLGATGGNQSETLTVAQVPALSGTTGNESATHTHAYPSISVQIGNGGTIQYTGSVLCPVGSVGCGGAPASTTESANHTHTFTTTGGNGAHPIVMPTSIINYIIKTLPDTNANSFFGVASIGGMTGIITCGFGVTCAAGQISAIASTVPPPTLTTLGGVFSLTCSTSNWFRILDNTGTFGCSQPSASDLSNGVSGTGSVILSTGASITSATINSPVISGAAIGIRSSGSGAFDLNLQNTENLTASRSFIITTGDTSRTLNMSGGSLTIGGTFTTANAFSTVGAFPVILNATGSTNITLPTSGTIFSTASTIPLANGGTGQSTAPSARASSGLNIDQFTGHGDSTYTVLSTDRTVGTNAAFTASRIWTLPAANSVNAGQEIVIADFQGTVTASNTLVISRAGADTVNGGTAVTITSANGAYLLKSDGTSKWTAQALGAAAAGGVSSVTCGTGLSGGTITTSGTCAISTARQTLPTIQKLTSGTSATYTTPANVLWIEVKMVGGGGAGAGGGTTAGTGGNGGTTSFGLHSAPGGTGGTAGTQQGPAGGIGGTIGAGGIGREQPGCPGSSTLTALTAGSFGGVGGCSMLGPGGQGANGIFAGGVAPPANSGGGGGGGGGNNSQISGPAGGGGDGLDIIIGSPVSTYTYTIGAGGTAGTAGTSGTAGGAGGSGFIMVIEHYGS